MAAIGGVPRTTNGGRKSWFRPVQPVVGRVRNTRRNLPIWISSPLTSTAESTGS